MSNHDTFTLIYGHWGEHPDFSLADWQAEVQSNDTRLGYWDWCETQAEKRFTTVEQVPQKSPHR